KVQSARTRGRYRVFARKDFVASGFPLPEPEGRKFRAESWRTVSVQAFRPDRSGQRGRASGPPPYVGGYGKAGRRGALQVRLLTSAATGNGATALRFKSASSRRRL